MIGNLYLCYNKGIDIRVLSINLREEEVLDAVCYYFPLIDEYKKHSLADALILYQVKVPKEKELINCYFSTENMKITVKKIRYYEELLW